MTELIENIIESSNSPVTHNQDEVWIPTSSTLLDLVCSDSIDKGFLGGRVYNIIGNSSSGKSFLALSLLASCCYLPKFEDYTLVYDDVETASSFDMNHLFGPKFNERVDLKHPSNCIEDFYWRMLTLIKLDKPFIYILDSFDALTCDIEIDKTNANLEARASGKKISGSYGMEKAKISSQLLREICKKMDDVNGCLFVISQTRDNVNPMSFSTNTRSGGRALGFYSSIVLWMTMKEKIAKTVDGQKHQIGVRTKVRVEKNKITGKIKETTITIKYFYGIDDVQDNINYLVSKKIITSSGRTLKWRDLQGTNDNLIKQIEENNLQEKLKKDVQKVWDKTEEKLIDRARIGKFQRNI